MSLSKKKLAAVIATGGSVVAGAALWLYSGQLDNEHEALISDQVEVVKAARNVPMGSPLTKGVITTEKVPRKFLPPNPLLESELNIYLGTPLAVNVEEGAMFLTADFSASPTPYTFESPLVIKSADLTMEADDPMNAGQKVLALVAERGGYVVSSDLFSNNETATFSLVARVPAPEFGSAVLALNEIGTLSARRIRGAGVTAEVRELEAKISSKRELEEGLAAAVKKSERNEPSRSIQITRGTSGDDVTIVRANDGGKQRAVAERKLAEAHHDVAELEIEASSLYQRVGLSTITLNIAQPRPAAVVPPSPTAGDELRACCVASWDRMIQVSFFLLRCLATLLPVIVFAGPFVLVGVFGYRRMKRIVH